MSSSHDVGGASYHRGGAGQQHGGASHQHEGASQLHGGASSPKGGASHLQSAGSIYHTERESHHHPAVHEASQEAKDCALRGRYQCNETGDRCAHDHQDVGG